MCVLCKADILNKLRTPAELRDAAIEIALEADTPDEIEHLQTRLKQIIAHMEGYYEEE